MYNQKTIRSTSQTLSEWVKKQKLSEVITAKVRRIHLKSHLFQSALDFPDAYRTSNQVDRPMNYFDRVLYSTYILHQNSCSKL